MTTKHETSPKMRGKPKRNPVKCLVPDCSGLFPTPDSISTGARGLCCDCYKKAFQLVKRGFTTWDELEYLGLAEPKYGSILERAVLLARKQKKAEEEELKRRTEEAKKAPKPRQDERSQEKGESPQVKEDRPS